MAPRLRNDLVATTADEQGVACVEVTDPVSGRGFRFYDFEYALAQQLTGQPLEDVVAWAGAAYGVDLSPDTLTQFLDKLEGLGFLVDGVTGAQPAIVAPYAHSGSFALSDGPTRVIAPPPVLDGAEFDHAEGDDQLSSRVAGGPGSGAPGAAISAASAKEPLTLLPRLEVLAGPLPPPVAAVDGARPLPSDETEPDEEATVAAVPASLGRPLSIPVRAPPPALGYAGSPSPSSSSSSSSSPLSTFSSSSPSARSPSAETPLASIAQAIAASTEPPPPGAIDVGGSGGRVSRPSDGRGSAPRPALSWASDLDQEVNQNPVDPVGDVEDRRQPPGPEVVVMPPISEPVPASPPARGRGRLAFLALIVVGGGLSAAVWFLKPVDGTPPPASSSESAPKVHTVSPQPTTFYRWFETLGAVVPGRDETLSFRVAGRVQEVVAPGTTFGVGETVVRLQGAAERELAVNRLRSRVAYFEQLRDSAKADGSELAVRQADAKLAARKQELEAAQAALADLEIRPKMAGEVAELLAPKGALVKVGAPVVRVHSAVPRATFALNAEDVARARALPFCRVETVPAGDAKPEGDAGTTHDGPARAIDCTLSAASPAAAPGKPDESPLTVDLGTATGLTVEAKLRLASARFDGVFPVPRAAVVHEGDIDHVWIVSGGGRFAERRTVELAGTTDAEALVAHGIAVGDAVVIDPPATLKAGAEINVAPAR